jgi:hypothetical protein
MYLSSPRNEDGDVSSSICMHGAGDGRMSLVAFHVPFRFFI